MPRVKTGKTCAPPRVVTVKGHWRKVKPRRKKRAQRAISPGLRYAVRDTRSGSVVSRHRSFTTAVQARRRLDRQAYRAGRGRPYEMEVVK